MGKRWVSCALSILFALFVTREALADTGGSMGGGDWSRKSSGGGRAGGGGTHSSGGGTHSSGGSTYSSGGDSTPSTRRTGSNNASSAWSWSSKRSSSEPSTKSTSYSNGYSRDDSSTNSSSVDSSSYHKPGDPLGFVAIIGGGILLVVIIAGVSDFWKSRSRVRSIYSSPSRSFDLEDAPADLVDVSVLRIAIDGRARKFVQTGLARLAETANTGTAEGRVTMLREVSVMLRRVRDAWVYGGAVNEPMRDIALARPAFDKYVEDARWKFLEERIRVLDGDVTRRDGSEYQPRSDEGDGLILVSIVIAARHELFSVNRIGDGEDLRKALEATSWITSGTLVAIEVVWQPYEDSDRLSSMELEAKYPRPEIIPITGALVGKVFCSYCSGPFPAELVSCPHCGAPAPGREAPKAA